jgi:hypothetical protein
MRVVAALVFRIRLLEELERSLQLALPEVVQLFYIAFPLLGISCLAELPW